MSKKSSSSSSYDGTKDACKACGKVGGDSRMVQCDKCYFWYDFDCVGVTQEVEDNEWLCQACKQSTNPVLPPVTNQHTGSETVPPVTINCTLPPPIPPVSTTVRFTVISNQGKQTFEVPTSSTSETVTTACVTAATVPPWTSCPSTGTNVPIVPLLNNYLMPPHPLLPPYSQMPLDPQVPTHSLLPPHSQMPAYQYMSPYYMMPPCQSTQINCCMPPMPPSTLSNVYGSVSGVTNRDFCYTVPSNSCQRISSVRNPVPSKFVSFVPTSSHQGRSRKQLSESLRPNHLSGNKQQVLEDNLSQRSGASSRRSTKQKQIELELQMLDGERKLQEAEEANRREYLRKRHELMKEMTNQGDSSSSISDRDIRIADWLDEPVDTFLHGLPARSMPEENFQPNPPRNRLREPLATRACYAIIYKERRDRDSCQ